MTLHFPPPSNNYNYYTWIKSTQKCVSVPYSIQGNNYSFYNIVSRSPQMFLFIWLDPTKKYSSKTKDCIALKPYSKFAFVLRSIKKITNFNYQRTLAGTICPSVPIKETLCYPATKMRPLQIFRYLLLGSKYSQGEKMVSISKKQ